MYFVRAKRNKTKVLLPAPEGKAEAVSMRKHLIGFDWDANVVELTGDGKKLIQLTGLA